jgi:hypothetical protein
LVAVTSDGSLIVGRGVPASWLGPGRSMSVSRFPTTDGERLDLRISSTGRSVSLTLSGQAPSGPVLFQLPSFVDNIAATTAGTINGRTGTVTLRPGTEHVTVRLRVGL